MEGKRCPWGMSIGLEARIRMWLGERKHKALCVGAKSTEGQSVLTLGLEVLRP